MTAEFETLFEGHLLKASVFWPEIPSGRLLITFRHRIPDPGVYDAPKPSLRFLRAGWAHLQIQSRFNDWYVNADTTALCAALVPFAAGFDHRTGIGFSMGAYGALRLSGALSMSDMIAISPQVSIAPDVVPFDRRFRADAKGFDAALGDLAVHACKSLQGVVIFDPFRPLDRQNAEMIGDILPQLALCRFGFGGHPAMGVVRETVGFGALQTLALRQKLTRVAVLALHRDNRAVATSWWSALAKHAEKTGRAALARRARAKARA